jgi:CheY-like chemotaxis protein
MSRVLIVDDEPDLLLMLRVSLEAAGFETGLAADGDEALRRVRAEHFDVMLLDMMMPVLDGWAVLGALKSDPTAPPIIVVTARTAQADKDQAFDLGAADFVSKPFMLEDLISRIGQVVGAPEES